MYLKTLIISAVLLLTYSCESELTEHLYIDAPLSDTSNWVLDYQDFQLNMTVVAELYLDGKPIGEDADLLGAFVGNSVRGLTDSYFFNEKKLYNILILSNQDEEYVQFGVYLFSLQKAVICADSIQFMSGTHLGDPDSPLRLNIK